MIPIDMVVPLVDAYTFKDINTNQYRSHWFVDDVKIVGLNKGKLVVRGKLRTGSLPKLVEATVPVNVFMFWVVAYEKTVQIPQSVRSAAYSIVWQEVWK